MGIQKIDPRNYVVLFLKGGNAQECSDAVAIDCDRGHGSHSEEWAALVDGRSVQAFLRASGATQIASEPWDGSRFGDGSNSAEINEHGTLIVD